MSSPLSVARQHAVLGAQHSTDQHRRVAIPLLGRFMRANREEYPCKLNDISVGGAAVMAPVVVTEGEPIVAYFDHIGGIEGTVVRTFEGGFAIQFNITAHKREKLASQLTWLVNKDVISGIEQRRHARIPIPGKHARIVLDDGETVDCKLIDVSISGASLGIDMRPPIGSELTIGKLRCRVMRYHERGIGVQFIDIQEPEALRRHFM
jgi:PilZ domain